VCVCLGFWVSKETLVFSFVIWEERSGALVLFVLL
jgi:hypothetical protein